MFRFLLLPVLVLLLIIFIIIADRVKHRSTSSHGTTAAQAETPAPGERKSGEDGIGASGETDVTEPETEPYDYANAELVRNTEPGIDRLVSSYLDAQCKGDADSMLRMFGRSDAEGTEELRAQIEAGKKLYDTFENTLSYVIPGVNDGEYIVYVTAQAWFRKVDTPAPMLLRAYAVTQDGQYYFRMDEDLTAEQAEAVRLADGSEAVLATIAKDLAEAGPRRGGARWREEAIARSVARSYAGASRRLTEEGAKKLVDELCACRMPYVCPRGKPTLFFMSTRELNRKFALD